MNEIKALIAKIFSPILNCMVSYPNCVDFLGDILISFPIDELRQFIHVYFFLFIHVHVKLQNDSTFPLYRCKLSAFYYEILNIFDLV